MVSCEKDRIKEYFHSRLCTLSLHLWLRVSHEKSLYVCFIMRETCLLCYASLCVSCTYKLEEHMSQGMVKLGFRLQTGLHCRQHVFVQLQDVLNI